APMITLVLRPESLSSLDLELELDEEPLELEVLELSLFGVLSAGLGGGCDGGSFAPGLFCCGKPPGCVPGLPPPPIGGKPPPPGGPEPPAPGLNGGDVPPIPAPPPIPPPPPKFPSPLPGPAPVPGPGS